MVKSKARKRNCPCKKKSISRQVKFIGIICAYFAIFQALIICGLALCGIICMFIVCGRTLTAASFRYVYLNKNFVTKCPMTIVKPSVFFLFCLLYIMLNVVWIVYSVILILVFRRWRSVAEVKRAANNWTIVTIVVLIFDLFFYLLCLIDLCLIVQDPDCKNHKMFFSGLESDLDPRGSHISINRTISTSKIPTLGNRTKDDMLNPFLHNKMWDQMSWPLQVKSKKKYLNKSDRSVLPLRHERHTHSLFQMNNLMSINANTPPEPKPIAFIPPMITMLVAVKLVLTWAANLLLLAYFRVKLSGLKSNIVELTISFFENLFPCPTKKKRRRRKKDCPCSGKKRKRRRKPRRKRRKKRKCRNL